MKKTRIKERNPNTYQFAYFVTLHLSNGLENGRRILANSADHARAIRIKEFAKAKTILRRKGLQRSPTLISVVVHRLGKV